MGPQSQYCNKLSEKAFLFGVFSSKRQYERQKHSLEELKRLAETAGLTVGQSQLFELRQIQSATYIGSGQAEKIEEAVKKGSYDVVIFDEDLSPTQTRNLETIFEVHVVDRTGLILDIFAQHARSSEGKLQVEIAQLSYLLPRLAGHGVEFSQLAGGIGTRGPGETRLEMDRRKAKERMSLLKRNLARVRSSRELHRSKRLKAPISMVSLIGYTNVGKSTLLNQLTRAGVLVEDKLFATLDPMVRNLKLPSGREVLLADTVGLIRKLPHQLIDAFRSTFEEAKAADLLIHLIDASHPDLIEQEKVVQEVLHDLDLDKKEMIRVLNKIDLVNSDGPLPIEPGDVLISAETGEGIEKLLTVIEEKVSLSFRRVRLCLPHSQGDKLSLLYRTGRILDRQDRSDGVYLEVELDEKNFNKFHQYRTSGPR
ncbi:MAG: GTPase HflX [Deltaproteobacteria bacterium]|nr:GTPase HflX [Deltaproteobacteria bacterium]